ncbi:hypothetical protein Hanom_Chr17g01543791 [Helianthus anomalus]
MTRGKLVRQATTILPIMSDKRANNCSSLICSLPGYLRMIVCVIRYIELAAINLF